jgi:hypothetical protein
MSRAVRGFCPSLHQREMAKRMVIELDMYLTKSGERQPRCPDCIKDMEVATKKYWGRVEMGHLLGQLYRLTEYRQFYEPQMRLVKKIALGLPSEHLKGFEKWKLA